MSAYGNQSVSFVLCLPKKGRFCRGNYNSKNGQGGLHFVIICHVKILTCDLQATHMYEGQS